MKGTSALQTLILDVRFPYTSGNSLRAWNEYGTVCYLIAAHATADTEARADEMLQSLATEVHKMNEGQMYDAWKLGRELQEWEHQCERCRLAPFEDEMNQFWQNPNDSDESTYEMWDRYFADLFGSDEDQQPKLWTVCTARVTLQDGQ